MSVNFAYLTGSLKDVFPLTVRRVSALVRNSDGFKIGISNDPIRRWNEAHRKTYDDMIVLYGSNSIDKVSTLEVALIERYAMRCDNLIAGGGGNIGPAPYFLYLVRKSSGEDRADPGYGENSGC